MPYTRTGGGAPVGIRPPARRDLSSFAKRAPQVSVAPPLAASVAAPPVPRLAGAGAVRPVRPGTPWAGMSGKTGNHLYRCESARASARVREVRREPSAETAAKPVYAHPPSPPGRTGGRKVRRQGRAVRTYQVLTSLEMREPDPRTLRISGQHSRKLTGHVAIRMDSHVPGGFRQWSMSRGVDR